MICNVNELKHNLNIECDYKDEDIYLHKLLLVAEEAVFNYLGKSKNDFNVIPESVRYAIIMLASQWYENRTPIAFASNSKIPYSFEFILAPYRNIIIS